MGWQKPKCLCIARSPWCKQITQLPTQRLCQIPFNIKVLDQGRDIQMSVSAADIPPNLGYSQLVFMHLLPKLFSSSCQSVWTIGKLCPFRHLQQTSLTSGLYCVEVRQWSGRWERLERGTAESWRQSCQGPKGTLAKDGETGASWIPQRYCQEHRMTVVCVRIQGRKRLSINVQIINFLKHWTPKRRTEPKSRGCFYERAHRRYGAVSGLDGVMWLEDINWNSALHFRALRGKGTVRNNLGI